MPLNNISIHLKENILLEEVYSFWVLLNSAWFMDALVNMGF
ncbi:hypothetical protein [Psychroflexus aurantiacus]|nr:hypothetical protein [Psychroflexus aurantiacus]